MRCEVCRWDSRVDPAGDRGLFQQASETLEGVIAFIPVQRDIVAIRPQEQRAVQRAIATG